MPLMAAGAKTPKTCYHTNEDCTKLSELGSQEVSWHYVESRELRECKHCNDTNKKSKDNNRGMYNALRDADPEDLTAD